MMLEVKMQVQLKGFWEQNRRQAPFFSLLGWNRCDLGSRKSAFHRFYEIGLIYTMAQKGKTL